MDPAEHRLTRDGIAVPLAPKAFELLLFLVQNQGRLLSKEQIMGALWPGSFVEEANLTVSISVLRKVLGEKEGNQRYIETIPKKGYRFIASVREVQGTSAILLEESSPGESRNEPVWPGRAVGTIPPEAKVGKDRGDLPLISSGPADSPRDRRWLNLLTAAILIVLVTAVIYFMRRKPVAPPVHPAMVQRSLAILPLRNLRQNPQDDFLGFSLADAVITGLGPISSLTVRPSSAIEKYKGQVIDLQKIGADLGVDTLLTGTFIHDGDHLRITYQLIDVKTEKILGRDTIDRKYENLFTVHDEVTQQIIRDLALNLSSSEAAEVNRWAPVNPVAYEYYLRGVDLMSSHDFPHAIEMLEKSAEIDPKYALTWAYLGQSYNSSASFQVSGREQYRRARAALQRALDLQPRQPEASIFLANLLIDTGEVEAAVPLLRDTLKSNPKNAAAHWELGYAYRFGGALRESVEECELARQIDPTVRANGSVLNAYLYLGQYDKFLASLPDVDDSSFLVFYRGFGEYHQRKLAQAARDFDSAYRLEHTMYTQTGKALGDAIVHRDVEGLQLLRDLENKIQQRGVGDPEGTYKIAEAYAVLGDKASAFRMLRYSIQHGFFAWPYFTSDPLFPNLSDEPQFSELMTIARDRHTAFRKRFF
ncbi:MAG TPA: winged helix-turn-helix domain-containing protein [Terracidiphilus sp.]|nr:winged helix-turn-helix domain-containing protein [Terracidiphilus sp.]